MVFSCSIHLLLAQQLQVLVCLAPSCCAPCLFPVAWKVLHKHLQNSHEICVVGRQRAPFDAPASLPWVMLTPKRGGERLQGAGRCCHPAGPILCQSLSWKRGAGGEQHKPSPKITSSGCLQRDDSGSGTGGQHKLNFSFELFCLDLASGDGVRGNLWTAQLGQNGDGVTSSRGSHPVFVFNILKTSWLP